VKWGLPSPEAKPLGTGQFFFAMESYNDMKRGLFLIGAGALVAAGCSHHGGSGLLPKTPGLSMPSGDALAAAFPAGPLPAQPIVGEVRRFDGDTAPANWVICDGSTLQVHDNPALAQIIGRSTGGDGVTTFNLPKARKFRMVIAVSGAVPRSPAELKSIFEKRGAPILPATKSA